MAVHQLITASLDVSKIDKTLLVTGQKGTYLNLALMMTNTDEGGGKYGDHYMIVQGVTKEQREQGIRGEILGNGKIVSGPHPFATTAAEASMGGGEPDWMAQARGGSDDEEELPF